jgi:hypothetical protein
MQGVLKRGISRLGVSVGRPWLTVLWVAQGKQRRLPSHAGRTRGLMIYDLGFMICRCERFDSELSAVA